MSVSDDEWSQLRAQVQELADHGEVATLIHRLGVCLDEARFDELAEILTEGATARTPGGLAEGRAAVVAQARRNHSADIRIQHAISDVMIQIDGDRASVRANLIATFARPSEAHEPDRPSSLGEVYHIDVDRTGEGWRLSRVETSPVWTIDTPVTPARR